MAEAAESPGDPGTATPRPLFAGLSDISISQDIPVEGEITIPMRSRIREFDSSTLNESVQNTISLCVLGYCILPLTVAMLVCRLVLLAEPGPINFMVRLFVVIVMFAWSIVASTAFLADSQPPNRKALAVYPVFLFYFVISWMILTFTPQ
ncbi:hypothetical protein E2I00_014143 [Balaenoptera physalus]|uniref:Protein YIPF n=1 Tax=Balaenoptera physalus TaxID=9770 RepID=A0A643BXQ9_BALPH|nr:hypothetical protein E2I00_014143 [Balaenoptera physalus]